MGSERLYRGIRGGGRGSGSARGAYYKALYGNRGAVRQGSSDSTLARVQPELYEFLGSIDGKQYGQYKQLTGRRFEFGGFTLFFDSVQTDAYAPPSKVRVHIRQSTAGFLETYYSSKHRSIASSHYLTQCVHRALSRVQMGQAVHGGSGGWHSAKGGTIAIDFPGQEVLERTSVTISDSGVEARLVAGLPAAGRTILGEAAQRMLLETLPQVVQQSLLHSSIDAQEMLMLVQSIEDQEHLRAQLALKKMVAFVGNGSVLPRSSGVSSLPLTAIDTVQFQSPESMMTTFELPNQGRVAGMGIPQGVTLVCGGGFNGKSTLLQAIERGVYNHVIGDGRELVITESTATKIKAEEGRSVSGIDIRSFINNLPLGKDTRCFSTTDASGSTSMAASIQEAIEAGASALLFDEDTCATNFLVRDGRMQQLVAQGSEPITPLICRVRELWETKGVSSILVIGGCGDYLDVADTVICMHEYRPSDITAKAREVAQRMPITIERPLTKYGAIPERIVTIPREVVAQKPPRAKTSRLISLFPSELDLSALDQLVSASQTRSIAQIIHTAALDRRSRTMRELLEDANSKALDELHAGHDISGNLARPRIIEVALAINRLRYAQMQPVASKR
ncbi:hypothetical protein COEREDRAFT_40609 [Coemansia reversa NRRL 1564]|uniref:P-loop containing nucleoside triphosphate hydrolase protein n=1 Tax=Coemansia reversa (strain ATCC 12441 / NRRL 1564) TaxID=763665 RepID=A0A2G5BF01_COERN|nr:hypothetical protein COEREDRAFT_40609 [Coemansia reversa NRRL 1564]|eukprot:PIA17584.1 hypothetical protein COEREDRAFT_40609 [Coemansia reversa NRRL 1564]